VNVVYISPEVAPFAKTGGLADIAGAIPKSLHKLGVDIIVFMPLYGTVMERNISLSKTDIQFHVKIGNEIKTGCVYKCLLPNSKVPIFFIGNDQYFMRKGLYNYPGTTNDYEDNSQRFIFFAKGVLEVINTLHCCPDIIHCNDWQTGLVPVYVRTMSSGSECFKRTKLIMTIHNLAYQGIFWHWDMKLTGLDWGLFNWRQLEFYGRLNFLKSGIVFSDIITTVSQTYAKEIQTHEYGEGLDGVLRERAKDLYGIINGIDYTIWNPETDKFICANYGKKNLKGKHLCKKALQKKCKLPEKDVPVIGMITRLTDQKGLDLIVDKFHEIMNKNLQFVLLGTGEMRYQELFRAYTRIFSEKVAVNLAFEEHLAHEIEAGLDIFLMPSRYEPCGLNQLYSLKYGTVPIVRHTGGLADTVVGVGQDCNINGNMNGFSFKEYNSNVLLATIEKALNLYHNKALWKKLMENGMKQDWSQEKSAREYKMIYEKVLSDK